MFDLGSAIISILVDVLLLPLQLVLVPFDALLSLIPGISAIPAALGSVITFVGALPSTMVYLFGINPIIWNSLFLIFILYIGLAPGIQLLKRIWAWVRL